MAISHSPAQNMIPIYEYVREPVTLISHLAHGWELHAGVPLTPAEERTIVREPALAVPSSLAARLGNLRVLVVPYVGCFETGDAVCFEKPPGETHSAVWTEAEGRINLVLSCRELEAHDAGLELLASLSQLAMTKMPAAEIARYGRLLEEELERGISGEIDQDALDAKEAYLKKPGHSGPKPAAFESYCSVSMASTLAEYMHGLWHDVQIRVGAGHLPVPQLRRRMSLLAEIFPPNPGYNLFAREPGEESTTES